MEDSTMPPNFLPSISYLADRRAVQLEGWFAKLCQSPIEVKFAVSFVLTASIIARPTRIVGLDEELPTERGVWDFFIAPQRSIGKYRADFIIGNLFRKMPLLVVECDGHDFHERTKEQAAADRHRDRQMIKDGYTVFRFTGSELHHYPVESAFEVIQMIDPPGGRS
ncbi:DUF559 domain-containing protein [Ensifer sp. ENS04]|jgi:very-short-patch-repair endonuclease|uniref:endonuclease domain-containing protein n=1 Tax=Ensifer sp. ENS04 TaxID=2769281 RepID=UPI0017830663|nr:DUF559 domain-containing protein [Ensifer sp. ENS04]MBD9540128.1 DUF559 domain-containing protein [Ensifer sp. ENS04]